jgi:hypothetical protein
VTFVDWDELARWKMINTVLDLGLAEPEETYSSSEHLYKTLNIPSGSTGRLVKAKPVAKVESRTSKSSTPVKKDAPKAKPERSRVRTKKFKDS